MWRAGRVGTKRQWVTAAALLPVWLLQACHAWQTQPITPRQAIEQRPLDRARLVGTDRHVIELAGPRIRGDSIAGLIGMEERAVALRDVSAVQIQRFSAGRTIALLTLGLALVVVTASPSAGTAPSINCIPFGC